MLVAVTFTEMTTAIFAAGTEALTFIQANLFLAIPFGMSLVTGVIFMIKRLKR